jgi:hypothetical protein
LVALAQLPEPPPPSASIDPSEIKEWLEWGGAKLLSMKLPPAAPQGYRSFWPDYPTDAGTAYGYTPNRLRAGTPTGKEVDLMDEVLKLPSLIADIPIRRIVNARALVAPVSNRHLYSWTKIAFMLHSSPRRVVLLHRKGLREIALRVPLGKADAIRQSMASLSM